MLWAVMLDTTEFIWRAVSCIYKSILNKRKWYIYPEISYWIKVWRLIYISFMKRLELILIVLVVCNLNSCQMDSFGYYKREMYVQSQDLFQQAKDAASNNAIYDSVIKKTFSIQWHAVWPIDSDSNHALFYSRFPIYQSAEWFNRQEKSIHNW